MIPYCCNGDHNQEIALKTTGFIPKKTAFLCQNTPKNIHSKGNNLGVVSKKIRLK